jgi:hypothetical protein
MTARDTIMPPNSASMAESVVKLGLMYGMALSVTALFNKQTSTTLQETAIYTHKNDKNMNFIDLSRLQP